MCAMKQAVMITRAFTVLQCIHSVLNVYVHVTVREKMGQLAKILLLVLLDSGLFTWYFSVFWWKSIGTQLSPVSQYMKLENAKCSIYFVRYVIFDLQEDIYR